MAAAPTDPLHHLTNNGEYHLLLEAWVNEGFICRGCQVHGYSGTRYRCTVQNCDFNLHSTCARPSLNLPNQQQPPQQQQQQHAAAPPTHPPDVAMHQQQHARPPPPPKKKVRGRKRMIATQVLGGLVFSFLGVPDFTEFIGDSAGGEDEEDHGDPAGGRADGSNRDSVGT